MRLNKFILSGFILAGVIWINIFFRAYPVNFPQFIVQAEIKAENLIVQEAAIQAEKKYSGLPDRAKYKLIIKFIEEYKKTAKERIKKFTLEEYAKLKDKYQDENGQTYLMELDCWHWGRFVDNVLKYGHPGDETKGGLQLDSLTLAPAGGYLSYNQFLFYLSAFLYKIFSFVKPVPLFTFLFYLPLLFTAVFISALYLFCLKKWGKLCALTACLFVGLAPVFLDHSVAGWFDMDILNLTFPLLIAWSYLNIFPASPFPLPSREGSGEGKNNKAVFLWTFIAAFWTGLFYFTWIGWWFIFSIIIIYAGYSILRLILARCLHQERNPELFKKHLLALGLFIIFSFFWIRMLSGSLPLSSLFILAKDIFTLNKPLTASIWPNVFSTVEELRRPELREVINLLGRPAFFFSALLSLLCLFLRTTRKRKYGEFEYESTVFFTLWAVSGFLACFKGVRFTIFLLLPLGISLGRMFNEAYHYFKSRNNLCPLFLFSIIFYFLAIQSLNAGYDKIRLAYPLINDKWYKILNSLKKSSPPEAVINSWWDFGDWFKAVANRKVIFDGQSQNTPQGYWMANVLITDDEKTAINTLRMLNNGGNQAFEAINRHFNNPLKSVLLLKKILASESAEAKKILETSLPPSVTGEIIRLIFEPPKNPAYFIVDPAMLGKMNAISYLGNWDFLKVHISQNLKNGTDTPTIDELVKLGENSTSIQKLHQESALLNRSETDNWISRRIRFNSDLLKTNEKGGLALFDNGLVYNPREQAVFFYSREDNKYKTPKSLFVLENNELKEIPYPDNQLAPSVLILKEQEAYQAIMLNQSLAKSLFTRLYFLNGIGLAHFKPFLEEKDGEGAIKVFEIIW